MELKYKTVAKGAIACLMGLMLASCEPVDEIGEDRSPPSQAVAPTPTPTPTPTRPPLATLQPAEPQLRNEQSPTTDEDETYVVQAGDTLAVISNRFYGEPDQWDRIYEANRDVIGPDPDQITVGMELRIPPRQ